MDKPVAKLVVLTAMKIGLIQTQRFGDLIITLPIAQHLARQGHEVLWTIHEQYLDCMRFAAPEVTFVPIEAAIAEDDQIDYFYNVPLERLRALGCEPIHPLYIHLTGGEHVLNRKLLGVCKFDEYKYALTGVPFREKWNLTIRRDRAREQRLHDSLNLTREYVLVHDEGSSVSLDLELPPSWRERYDIVKITPVTDTPFDWLTTIERAAKRVFLDSAYANLTEQLNITGENYLVLRSPVAATPVYRNGWTFCWPLDPITEREAL